MKRLNVISCHPRTMVNESNIVVEKPVSRNSPNKKNLGRVPKKIHKAAREKLKRDHLNELFLELDNALEPTRQNNGKASILCDTCKLLRDLLMRVKSLKKENATLLTETHYVTVEKNELKDENSTLEAEIVKLRNDIRERMQSQPIWPNGTDAATNQPHLDNSASSLSENLEQPPPPATNPCLEPPSVVGSVFVIPLPQNLQAYSDPKTMQEPFKPPSQVKRPHARYPTPSDSWPSQLLGNHPPKMFEATGRSVTTSPSATNRGQEEHVEDSRKDPCLL